MKEDKNRGRGKSGSTGVEYAGGKCRCENGGEAFMEIVNTVLKLN